MIAIDQRPSRSIAAADEPRSCARSRNVRPREFPQAHCLSKADPEQTDRIAPASKSTFALEESPPATPCTGKPVDLLRRRFAARVRIGRLATLQFALRASIDGISSTVAHAERPARIDARHARDLAGHNQRARRRLLVRVA
ncbi:MAG: hypothetical protein H6709_02250 [Kofleriaceae bacterium]|nr:hypothetical protein [Kofleriaceae bacterium]